MTKYTTLKSGFLILLAVSMMACTTEKKKNEIQSELLALDLTRGDITLCSPESGFGNVSFNLSCSDHVKANFNLATALLHSFEYTEAEKVYVKIIEEDPQCVMAYWGVAMCNFHPLWAPPSPADLKKGEKIITLARSIVTDTSSRESNYLEAIATIYDQWDKIDHRTRVVKFEKASENIFEKYRGDQEAAIFYALALDAAADPKDKSFVNQKKAGAILNTIFTTAPNHPGITHYIIHNYDYPELAELALPAARKYASIAAASAHAQHMPSHIFTRLGLWDESIQSNLKSVAAAQCYAENTGMKGHWDEELHGMDYLVYAYLQQGNDAKALEQVNYLKTINDVFPPNFKIGYSCAAIPARYAVERKDWQAATKLELTSVNLEWDKFQWEAANVTFGRLLGFVHIKKLDSAKNELAQLEAIHKNLSEAGENYKANLVLIQVKACDGWIKLAEGKKSEATNLMIEAADMEDATAKHPVTPGEIIPARELLGDMYMEMGDFPNAVKAYKEDLSRHPNRFNGLYGAGFAEQKVGNTEKARAYYNQLLAAAKSTNCSRTELTTAKSYMAK